MIKKSVLIAGRHATSISLEKEFYEELCRIASDRKISFNLLVTQIDRSRSNQNLSSALRLYVLNYYKEKSAAPE